ncbi:hypothetical protein F0562_028347 [Nyssa sinensis]|uniref:Uncharacterized protein n=1 Tax=Nyssa sinensis TaxID=561372 RepID=A0A5J5B7U3_9ASTE|nr:hypothetical protein F0562_028347 [Nyssa sinensis]
MGLVEGIGVRGGHSCDPGMVSRKILDVDFLKPLTNGLLQVNGPEESWEHGSLAMVSVDQGMVSGYQDEYLTRVRGTGASSLSPWECIALALFDPSERREDIFNPNDNSFDFK